ncbi:uncharacterized protein [Periplaneta americana]|uniref:uncharacterized protein n=1 Tax=Periplaneta americana TaxID=6978 RepID=UPI0037E7A093
MSKRSSKIMCCVFSCNNRYCNTEKNVKFYSFPSRPHEMDLKRRWIIAVNRKEADGTLWTPSKSSRICSEHFIGGCKSQNPASPAYVPSIFPECYKRESTGTDSLNRFKRLKKRTEIISQPDTSDPLEDSASILVTTKTDAQTQTDRNYDKESNFEFSCMADGNNVSTQACISAFHALYAKPKCSSKLSGSDSPYEKRGFFGYSSISDESQLNVLAGVNTEIFNLFLNLLSDSTQRKISKENKLLIFLMKMKLALPFAALAVIFNVHRSTISRIFQSVLPTLAQATKNFVFWPSKDTVNATLPTVFKDNYPNCRAIIDCTEIKTEQPPEISQRVYMYSNYKSAYTAKVLIGIAPCGMVTFISKCYGGRASDSFITNDCGILKLIEPGDQIMADKVFPGIKTVLEESNAILVMPPFMNEGHLTPDQVDDTYNIASVRIHVERCIQRVKVYNILQKCPSELLHCIDDIVHMCCVMTNVQPPLISEDHC